MSFADGCKPVPRLLLVLLPLTVVAVLLDLAIILNLVYFFQRIRTVFAEPALIVLAFIYTCSCFLLAYGILFYHSSSFSFLLRRFVPFVLVLWVGGIAFVLPLWAVYAATMYILTLAKFNVIYIHIPATFVLVLCIMTELLLVIGAVLGIKKIIELRRRAQARKFTEQELQAVTPDEYVKM